MAPVLPNHENLLGQLRGSKVTLPDFSAILSKLPSKANAHYLDIKDDVDKKIDSLSSLSKEKLARLKAADFALFASYYWPNANIDELKTLAYLVVWVFAWDDEMDEIDGQHTHNSESGPKFCEDTVKFVQYHLGLGSGAEPLVDDPIISNFKVMWEQIRDAYSKEQNEAVLAETKSYINAVLQEHSNRLSDSILETQVYGEIRTGASGVGISSSLVDYSYRIRAPRSIKQDPLVEKLWDECNIIISFTNDILSLQKETTSGMISNIVSLLTAERGIAQTAVNEAYKMVLDAIDRFEHVAKEVLSQPAPSSISENELQIIVNGIQDTCVGNLHWHFASRRYGLQAVHKHAGSFELIL